MTKVALTGLGVFNGEYDLDLGYFTNRELHLVKQVSGVRAGEIGEALGAGDNDVLVALAAIAVKRAGKDIPLDMLWDAPSGSSITLVADEEEEPEADASLPPQSAPDA